MKRIHLIYALAFLSISGCAQNMQWAHSFKGQQEFYADRARCSSMSGAGQQNQVVLQQGDAGLATGLTNGMNIGSAMGANRARGQIFDDCMMGNGWYLVPAS